MNKVVVDIAGKPVTVGSTVRLLTVRKSILDRLDPKAREKVAEALHQLFSIYEIDEWGGAWIKIVWTELNQTSRSESISLAKDEMKVVA